MVPVLPDKDKVVPVPEQTLELAAEMLPATVGGLTVTVLVAVAFEHPPVPVMVYVIVDVPAATGVITPDVLLMVATAWSLEVHAPPELPFEVKVVVPLEQIACVPEIVPAFGAVVMVTVTKTLLLSQPLLDEAA